MGNDMLQADFSNVLSTDRKRAFRYSGECSFPDLGLSHLSRDVGGSWMAATLPRLKTFGVYEYVITSRSRLFVKKLT